MNDVLEQSFGRMVLSRRDAEEASSAILLDLFLTPDFVCRGSVIFPDARLHSGNGPEIYPHGLPIREAELILNREFSPTPYRAFVWSIDVKVPAAPNLGNILRVVQQIDSKPGEYTLTVKEVANELRGDPRRRRLNPSALKDIGVIVHYEVSRNGG